MPKNIVSIFECKDGYIVADDIIDSRGILIVSESTTLNTYIINRLIELKFMHISVYDQEEKEKMNLITDNEYELFSAEYKESVSAVKKLIIELSSGNKFDKYEFDKVMFGIYNKIEQVSNIIQFLQIIRAADEYTYTHSLNTAFYCMLIAKWMKFSEAEIKKVIQAGLLHDIGKTKIPLEILNKKGILTKSEYELIKNHTVWGYEMLNDICDIDPVIKKAVLLHHERVDRSGYPYALDFENINIYARIIAVADVFDAMTSDRVYKKRSTPFEAFEMLQTVGIGIFDTAVITAFLKNMAAYYVGADVLLNNGDTGQIVYVPVHDITCPVIKSKTSLIDLSGRPGLKISAIIGTKKMVNQ